MIKLSTTTIANNYTISDIHLHSHHNPDPLLFFQFFRRYTTNLDTRYHTSSLIYHHHFLTFSPFMAICTTVSGSSIAIFDFFWGRAVPPISWRCCFVRIPKFKWPRYLARWKTSLTLSSGKELRGISHIWKSVQCLHSYWYYSVYQQTRDYIVLANN